MNTKNIREPVQHVASHPLSPQNAFMSLPREIRDAIYSLVLVSSSTIIVWKGEWVTVHLLWDEPISAEDYYDSFVRNQPWSEHRVRDEAATTSSLSSISVSLLLCSKTISQEAAQLFYNKNTFSFLGNHNWDPIVSWLQIIGAQNREHLSSLEFNAYRPEEVWQRFDGQRVGVSWMPNKEPIYPRHPYLGLRHPIKYGMVGNINPALETIFELLGSRALTNKVTLTFRIRGEYPGEGVIIEHGDQCSEHGWYSMDLPNLVEKFRVLHSTRPDDSDSDSLMEVLWKGPSRKLGCFYVEPNPPRITVEDHLKNMRDHGWEVELLPTEEPDSEEKAPDEPFVMPPYVLRRKLKGPLMAGEPNPCSGIYIENQSVEDFMGEVTGWYGRGD